MKLAKRGPQWRNFTAMDEYYQNGPLPTWIGWYVQHLPHGVHAFATGAMLVLELGLVFLMFLPRPLRILCFFIVTAWQIPVILTANYTFLNYLVLLLGVLLLDDRFFERILPESWRHKLSSSAESRLGRDAAGGRCCCEGSHYKPRAAFKLAISSVMLLWIYDHGADGVDVVPSYSLADLAGGGARVVSHRNRYGLFAVMTRGRYEIEFQGSDDGEHWRTYPFLYKPQNPEERPRIYAPYQPRFDWNFGSLPSAHGETI